MQLKELFTTFKLENALNMDGKYAIRAINKQKVILKNTKQKPTKSNSSKSFNNFEGRNYTKEEYDNIENKLLGWE